MSKLMAWLRREVAAMSRPLKIWFTIGIAMICVGVIGFYSPIALMSIGIVLVVLGGFWKYVTKNKYFAWLLFVDKVINDPPKKSYKDNSQTYGCNSDCSLGRATLNKGSSNNNCKTKSHKPFLHNMPPKDEK